MKKFRLFSFYWLPPLSFMGLIFGLSGRSHPPGAELIPDYISHAIEYGILALLLFRAFANSNLRMSTLAIAIITGVIAFAYGLSDEFHQSLIAYRDANIHDVGADLVGIFLAQIGVITFRKFHGIRTPASHIAHNAQSKEKL